MTEEGVYKTIVQFPFLPVPLAAGGECWLPAFDAMGLQHGTRCMRPVAHAARSGVGREGSRWHAEADTQSNPRRRPAYSGAEAWRPFIPSFDIKAPGHLEQKPGLPPSLATVQRERRGCEEREGGEE